MNEKCERKESRLLARTVEKIEFFELGKVNHEQKRFNRALQKFSFGLTEIVMEKRTFRWR